MNTLSKAISILSISLIINMGGVEIIAQTQCYTTNYNKAEQLYRQGRYAEAKRYYKAASACPDKPKQNNIAARISACDAAINEIRQRERAEQQRQEAEREREEAERYSCNIEFGDMMNDYGCVFLKLNNNTKDSLHICHGVEVTRLSDGIFKNAGIEEGLIILEINNMPVDSQDDIEKIYDEIMRSQDIGKVMIIKGLKPTGKRVYFAIPLYEEEN